MFFQVMYVSSKEDPPIEIAEVIRKCIESHIQDTIESSLNDLIYRVAEIEKKHLSKNLLHTLSKLMRDDRGDIKIKAKNLLRFLALKLKIQQNDLPPDFFESLLLTSSEHISSLPDIPIILARIKMPKHRRFITVGLYDAMAQCKDENQSVHKCINEMILSLINNELISYQDIPKSLLEKFQLQDNHTTSYSP